MNPLNALTSKKSKTRLLNRMRNLHPRTLAIAQFMALCGLIISGLFTQVESIPRFSAEMGMDCGSCHFAQGGGAIRNQFGHFTMSVNTLSLTSTRAKLLKDYKKPKLSDGVTVGADARWRLLDDGSLGRYQADFYLAIEMLKLTFLNVTLNSSGIDESYFLYDRAYSGLWIQAGRFYPQYGLRLDDFSSLVRQRTGIFHRKAIDGLAIGTKLAGHSLSATYFSSGEQSVALFNLNRFDSYKQLGYFYGLSLRHSEELTTGGHGANPALKGAYLGLGIRNYSIIIEGDLIGESNDAYAIYIGASVRFIPGVYGKIDYNFYDPDRRLQSGAESFTRISAEIWPIPFVEVNPGVTFHTDGPLAGQEVYELRFHIAY